MKIVNVYDVLKILHTYGKYIFVTDEKRYSAMVDEISNLTALRGLENPNKWILCSEQVPTESGRYLITWTCKWGSQLKRSIDIAEYNINNTQWYKWYHNKYYNEPMGDYEESVQVVAWMSLPEPYTAESEEK